MGRGVRDEYQATAKQCDKHQGVYLWALEHDRFWGMCYGSTLRVSEPRPAVGGGQGNFSSDLTGRMEVVVVGKRVNMSSLNLPFLIP